MNRFLYTLLLFMPLTAAAKSDTIVADPERIERYVDSMAARLDGSWEGETYGDGYYKMIERRHLREKGSATFDIRPTYFDSPFVKPHDWC